MKRELDLDRIIIAALVIIGIVIAGFVIFKPSPPPPRAVAPCPLTLAPTYQAQANQTQTATIRDIHRRFTDQWAIRSFTYFGEQIREINLLGGHGFELRPVGTHSTMQSQGGPTSVTAASHGAIVATNGDFVAYAAGLKHLFLHQSTLWTSGTQGAGGVQFYATKDDKQAWIGPYVWQANVVPGSGHALHILHWNAGQACGGNMVAFNRFGGSVQYPAFGPTATLTPEDPKAGSAQTYEVTSASADAVVPEGGQVVLQGDPAATLTLGSKVDLTIDYGHDAVTNSFGGIPQFVQAGANTGQGCIPGNCGKVSCGKNVCDNPLLDYNPRTAVGVSHGCEESGFGPCHVFLVTDDGRQPGWSAGMQLPEMGNLMIQLGAWDALNLDGGGSTTMWIRRPFQCQVTHMLSPGCLMNRPVYGERWLQQIVDLVPSGI